MQYLSQTIPLSSDKSNLKSLAQIPSSEPKSLCILNTEDPLPALPGTLLAKSTPSLTKDLSGPAVNSLPWQLLLEPPGNWHRYPNCFFPIKIPLGSLRAHWRELYCYRALQMWLDYDIIICDHYGYSTVGVSFAFDSLDQPENLCIYNSLYGD